jgi:hypothetical protein
MVSFPPIRFTMALPGSTGSLQAAPQIQSIPSRPHRRQQAEVLELLRPGTFVCLSDHPKDLPPFELIHCRGGRCWIRQQAWGELIHLEVPHRQISAAV